MGFVKQEAPDPQCGFPGCRKDFDQRPDADCAATQKGGRIVAFCRKHSARLKREGVGLSTTQHLCEFDQKERREEEEREYPREERERDFIKSLK